MPSQAQRLREARTAFRAGSTDEMNGLVSECVASIESATTDAKRAELSHSLASFYRDIGCLSESEHHARKAVDWVRRTCSTALLGNHLMFLALLLGDTGRPSEALPCVEEALGCYEAVYGREHRETRYVLRAYRDIEQQCREHRPGAK